MSARRRFFALRPLLLAVLAAVSASLLGGCAVGVGPDYVAFGDPYRAEYRRPYWAGAPGPYYRGGYYRGPRGWDGYGDHVARFSVDYAARGMAVHVR